MATRVKNMLLKRGQQAKPRLEPIVSPLMRAMVHINNDMLEDYSGTPDIEHLKNALMAVKLPTESSTRNEWRDCLWGFRAGGGALDVALKWSRNSHAYTDDAAVITVWNDYKPDGGITAGTLIHIAERYGFVRMAKQSAVSANEALALQGHSEVIVATPFRLTAHIHPWSLNDPVPKSHNFLIGTGGAGLFPLGGVSVVASPGGMMKTSVAISILLHLASGQPWAGLAINKASGLLLALEDDKDETTRRLIATARAQIDPSNLDGIEARVSVAGLSGIDARLTINTFGSSERTGVAAQIIGAAKALVESSGYPVRLIVVDHSRLAIGGDANDSGHVTELTRALAHIAKETGAAVVLLCHSPKATVNPNRTGDYTAADVLGSGAFVDNARFACVLTTLTDDERKAYATTPEVAKRHVALRIIKSNYSETGRVFYLRKTPVEGWGVVVPDVVTLAKPVREYVPPPSNVDKVHSFLLGHVGRFTKTGFKARAGTDGPMGIGVAAATAALNSLIESGRVILRAPTPEEIETHGHGRQAKEVLHAV